MNNKDLEEKEKMKRRSQWEAFDQMVDDFASKNACTSSEKEALFHWLEDYSRKEWKKASTEPTYEESKLNEERKGLKARIGEIPFPTMRSRLVISQIDPRMHILRKKFQNTWIVRQR